jgi:SAM-dependent methyltransferase
MAKHFHIDQEINIRTGEEAKEALQKENDLSFLSQGNGIIKVSPARWEIAQIAEDKHWIGLGCRNVDDRNYEHFTAFDGYRVLQDQCFPTAIELGCGPFTNLRLIGNVARIADCALLDPLVERYLRLQRCSYTQQYLFLDPPVRLGHTYLHIFMKIAKRFLPVLYRMTRKRRIPVSQHIPKPIEQMPTDRLYDLVVIINVIEHCYNINKVFDRILKIMKKDSIIIFHDKLYDHSNVVKSVEHEYDAAHPLKVDQDLTNNFLYENFTPLYERVADVSWKFIAETFSRKSIYFIGKKSY